MHLNYYESRSGRRTLIAIYLKYFTCRSLNQASHRGTTKQHAQKISKEKLSKRLDEMNEQFDAIEVLTTNMEQDIQQSNRVRIYHSI